MKFFAIAAVLLVGACDASSIPHLFLDGRIIGGSEIKIEDAAWQVSLQRSSGAHFCGGSIISPVFVVTAAHCTDGQSASALSVRAGTGRRGSGGVVVKVSQINQHPQYNGRLIDYDISLLRLASSLQYSNSIQPVGLPSVNQNINENINVLVTGWGTTSEGSSSLPTALQGVTVQTVSNPRCADAYGSSSITARMMCAGVNGGGKDACQGDSGGPLVSGKVLLGITSWGYGCARPNYPGVYANVPALRQYIQQIAGI